MVWARSDARSLLMGAARQPATFASRVLADAGLTDDRLRAILYGSGD